MDKFPGAVRKELECPVCLNLLEPPISLCDNGHSVCTSCRTQLVECPTCRAAFSTTKCIALEKVVGEIKVTGNNQASDSKEVKLNSLSLDVALLMKCCECGNFLRAPVSSSRNRGGLVCGPCMKGEPINRHVCFEQNDYIGKTIEKFIFPCFNQGNGCPESGLSEEMRKHKVLCHWGSHTCPLKKFGWDCSWEGNWTEIKNHLSDKHAGMIKCMENNSISVAYDVTTFIVFVFDQIFLYNQTNTEGESHCIMLMLATEQEASKYKYTLNMEAENGVENISETKLVRSFGVTADGICNPCRCSIIDDIVHQSYIKSNKITYKISQVGE